MIYILIVFLAGMRDYTTTLRINSIELLKPVDNTIDRTGFEPPMNKDPMSVLWIKLLIFLLIPRWQILPPLTHYYDESLMRQFILIENIDEQLN